MLDAQPHTRMWLTVDLLHDVLRLGRFSRDFGVRMPTTKLGPEFLTYPDHGLRHKRLRDHGIKTALDDKHAHNAEQMGSLVHRARQLGFRYTTVSPAVGEVGLIHAAMEQRGISVIAAIQSTDKVIRRREFKILRAANKYLDPEHQISRVMCNVSDIGRVQKLDGVMILATGIRMPGDPRDDQPAVATPAEALAAGASVVAVGRSITRADDHVVAFERVLENIASVS